MKKIVLILVLLSFVNHLHSQNILDVFYSIPDAYVSDLPLQERKEIVANKKLFYKNFQVESTTNFKKNFLFLEFSKSNNRRESFNISIKYWELSEGFLIAVSKIRLTSSGYYQDDFKFLKYASGKFTVVNKGYLKGYSSDFSVFMNNLETYFFKKTLTDYERQNLRDGDIYFSFQYTNYAFDLRYNYGHDYSYYYNTLQKLLESDVFSFEFDYNQEVFIQKENRNFYY